MRCAQSPGYGQLYEVSVWQKGMCSKVGLVTECARAHSEEQMVQQLVASMAGWKTILQSGLPCLLILFWGSWSDRYVPQTTIGV